MKSLSDRHFHLFRDVIYRESGINLTAAKKVMLEGRLQKRMRTLGITGFEEYYKFLMTPERHGEELVFLINEVSTNKTEFFRESDHFSFLCKVVVPEWLKRKEKSGAAEPFRVWSAGCSTGEEPYTLAMVLQERLAQENRDFTILASDISTRVLAEADKAIYSDLKMTTVPKYFLKKYFMRGTGRQAGCHKIVPELRRKVRFRRINFLDAAMEVGQAVDVIFCRNVMIYFDTATQEKLWYSFHGHLVERGYLFVGHSETLLRSIDYFERLVPAVYRRKI